MPADYSKVHRLLLLLVLMQQGTAGNAANLARRFGVRERTIYRDLQIIADLDIPYYFDEESRTYRTRGDFYLPPFPLTRDETAALLARLRQTEPLHRPLTEPASRAIEKLRTLLPSEAECVDTSRNGQSGQAHRVFSVVMDVHPDAAARLGGTSWHHAEEIRENEDGSLTYRCDSESLDELVWWILSFGPQVCVRQPVELVEMLGELIRDMKSLYPD
jgi:predicted DNA-binding transcriptional regulator YafY